MKSRILATLLAIWALFTLSCVTTPETAKKGSTLPRNSVAIVGRVINQPAITQTLKTLGEAYQKNKTMIALSTSPDAKTRPMYLDAKGGVIVPAVWGEYFVMTIPRNQALWFQRAEVALLAEGGDWVFGVLDPKSPIKLDVSDKDEIIYIGDLVYHVEETNPSTGVQASWIEVRDNSREVTGAFTGFLTTEAGKPAAVTTRLLSDSAIPLATSTYGYTTVIVWR